MGLIIYVECENTIWIWGVVSYWLLYKLLVSYLVIHTGQINIFILRSHTTQSVRLFSLHIKIIMKIIPMIHFLNNKKKISTVGEKHTKVASFLKSHLSFCASDKFDRSGETLFVKNITANLFLNKILKRCLVKVKFFALQFVFYFQSLIRMQYDPQVNRLSQHKSQWVTIQTYWIKANQNLSFTTIQSLRLVWFLL